MKQLRVKKKKQLADTFPNGRAIPLSTGNTVALSTFLDFWIELRFHHLFILILLILPINSPHVNPCLLKSGVLGFSFPFLPPAQSSLGMRLESKTPWCITLVALGGNQSRVNLEKNMWKRRSKISSINSCVTGGLWRVYILALCTIKLDRLLVGYVREA